VRNNFACAACTSNASFNPITGADPQPVVSCISVVGSGTDPSGRIR
jgi:hypothetical protein